MMLSRDNFGTTKAYPAMSIDRIADNAKELVGKSMVKSILLKTAILMDVPLFHAESIA